MALINKIREKSGIAVAVIAVALMFFIVGSDIFSRQQGGGLFGEGNVLGTINGTDIDLKQFNTLLENQRQQYQAQTGRAPSEDELSNIREQIWQQLVQENAFAPEFEELGLSVSGDELRELLQGAKNMHPYVRQQFTDPNTGVFNEENHRTFITQAANKTLPLPQQQAWDQFKSSMIEIRKAEKFQNLLSKTSFITTAEAKKEYVAQNTKLSVNYLYVPFYSVPDSTVEASDSEISSYYNKHEDEFTPYDSRNLEYVVFQITPSKEDSAGIQQDIKTLARGLAAATDAAAFAAANSDERSNYLKTGSEVSVEVKEAIRNGIVGAVIGPFKQENNYIIHKYEGTETDSLYTAGASHILIRSTSTDSDSLRSAARAKAQDLLSQINAGADFATLARINSQDPGSGQNGGDLGYFQNNGTMVKPFEDAIFNFNGTGVIPRIVETDFGFHIIKVTDAKSNLRYKLATIVKILAPSEVTKNEIYQKADDLKRSISSLEDLRAKVKEEDNLILLTAQRVAPGARFLNTLDNAGEIVRWAYNSNTSVGDISDIVFETDENFVIAGLAAASDKDDPKAEDFKDQITAKIKNDKKAEQIIAKLKDKTGTLESIASGYGAGALVETVADINLKNGLLKSPGLDPIAIGTAFGMKPGIKKGPFKGDQGVFIMDAARVTKAGEIADYSQYKEEIKQFFGPYAASQAADQAIRENAKIVDKRAKFF